MTAILHCLIHSSLFSSRHEDSPVKRGPGRPRKRKNCSNSKSNTNNEPDMSAANSPAADQMETGSASPEANPADDVDEGGEGEEAKCEEAKCEMDPVGMCEDNGQEEDTKLVVEGSSQVFFASVSDRIT